MQIIMFHTYMPVLEMYLVYDESTPHAHPVFSDNSLNTFIFKPVNIRRIYQNVVYGRRGESVGFVVKQTSSIFSVRFALLSNGIPYTQVVWWR